MLFTPYIWHEFEIDFAKIKKSAIWEYYYIYNIEKL